MADALVSVDELFDRHREGGEGGEGWRGGGVGGWVGCLKLRGGAHGEECTGVERTRREENDQGVQGNGRRAGQQGGRSTMRRQLLTMAVRARTFVELVLDAGGGGRKGAGVRGGGSSAAPARHI